ncbi:MAG: RNA polymerase factor sigma-54 [Candidatus Omnitrophica bacterium]|nr:RNA polymerase factor sigma-54 [Candidatus Omnitrophota bacterium]
MALQQKLFQKQVQKMIMSAKMQQSMHILQLNVVELDQLIAEEMAVNPVLEDTSLQEPSDTNKEVIESPPEEMPKIRDQENISLEPDWLDNDNVWFSDFFDRGKISQSIEKHNFQETMITNNSSMQDELMQQFRIMSENEDDLLIAEQIIGNIAENGYLVASVEEISRTNNFDLAKVHQVLDVIQGLEPAGIGARDLRECLLLQLKRQSRENSIEAEIVKNYLKELAAKKYTLISSELKLPLPQVKKYAQRISALDPKPCRSFAAEALSIVPDVILEKAEDKYEVIINSKNLPKLSISQLYKKMLKEKKCEKAALEFIREKLQNAQNLINGLSQREQTLERVSKCIIEYQQDFIEKGISNLKPLTLKEIAEKLEVHPSTISRTVANKYMQTPYGTFALKKFFSQAISTEQGSMSNQNIKATIDELVKTEPENKPLSDQDIVGLLIEKGMPISRRTVTKYRNALKIPAAHLRRK